MENVTVIIPTFGNRPKLLNNLLKVVTNYSLFNQVIVANTSGKSLKLTNSSVQVVSVNNLLKAKNTALKSCVNNSVLLLDDDIVVTKDELDKFFLKVKQTNVDAASPFVVSGTNYKNPDFLNLVSFAKLSFYKVASLNENKVPLKPYKPDFLPGCFMFFKKSQALKIGGWDTNYIFPFYNEDTDITYRIKQSGVGMLIFPQIKVIHKKYSGGVRTKINKSKWFYAYGFNNSYYLTKNFSVFTYLLYSIFRFRDHLFVLKQLNFGIYKRYIIGVIHGFKKAKNKRTGS